MGCHVYKVPHASTHSAAACRSDGMGDAWLDDHYRISRLCRVLRAHGKGLKTLGNMFAECNTRHTTVGIHSAGKPLFAECFISRTRQTYLPRAKYDTRQKKRPNGGRALTVSLPSV
jgi:hypothetical protein